MCLATLAHALAAIDRTFFNDRGLFAGSYRGRALRSGGVSPQLA